MFTVVIQALSDSVQDLQMMVRKLNRQIQQTEDIVSSIRRISEYEEVIHVLRRHLETMETEKRSLMEMMAALSQTQKLYMLCERNIMEYGDQIRAINGYRQMSIVNLSAVSSGIRGYQIR